jgi:hypothetical protein
MSCEHVVCSLWDECNKILGEELKPLCAAESNLTSGCNLTPPPQTMPCFLHAAGHGCNYKISLSCGLKPCIIDLTNCSQTIAVGGVHS